MKHLTLLFSLALTGLAFASPTRGSLASRGASLSNAPEMPTAASYIQDGLVAIWDGIENAGWNKHSSNVTVWKDLIGNRDMTLTRVATEKDCMYFAMDSYASCSFPINYGTIEIVLWKKELAEDGSGKNCIITIGSVYSGWGLCARANYISDTKDSTISPAVFFSAEELFTISQIRNQSSGQTLYAFKNGIGVTTKTPKDSRYNMGSNSINGTYTNARNSIMRHYCIRIYDKALTDDEIAHNYKIDKARFNLP